MLKQYQITPVKTYANKKNAERAVAKMLEKNPGLNKLPNNAQLVWSVMWNEQGRCFPVFFGITALEAGIHHLGFNCLAFS
jgi:hypothetical protein